MFTYLIVAIGSGSTSLARSAGCRAGKTWQRPNLIMAVKRRWLSAGARRCRQSRDTHSQESLTCGREHCKFAPPHQAGNGCSRSRGTVPRGCRSRMPKGIAGARMRGVHRQPSILSKSPSAGDQPVGPSALSEYLPTGCPRQGRAVLPIAAAGGPGRGADRRRLDNPTKECVWRRGSVAI